MLLPCLLVLAACGRSETPGAKAEEETLSRTEFTERIENYFEYTPIRPRRVSRLLIHLTDLSDGSPVDNAEVVITMRREDAAVGGVTNARAGRVTGIYVAEVTVPEPGAYTAEFHVKNAKLDERMTLAGMQVR